MESRAFEIHISLETEYRKWRKWNKSFTKDVKSEYAIAGRGQEMKYAQSGRTSANE
jgi:hypothetical protein